MFEDGGGAGGGAGGIAPGGGGGLGGTQDHGLPFASSGGRVAVELMGSPRTPLSPMIEGALHWRNGGARVIWQGWIGASIGYVEEFT